MDLSKNNNFLTEEAINFIPRTEKRKNPVFIVTIFQLQDILKDEKLLHRGRLGDKQNVYWEYLYLTNLNLHLINVYLTYLYLTNQGESKMR